VENCQSNYQPSSRKYRLKEEEKGSNPEVVRRRAECKLLYPAVAPDDYRVCGARREAREGLEIVTKVFELLTVEFLAFFASSWWLLFQALTTMTRRREEMLS